MKNPILAFLLAFFPGGGLLYLGRLFRGIVYMFGEFGLIAIFFLFMNTGFGDYALVIFFLGVMLYVINLIDTAITASKSFATGMGAMEEKKDPTFEQKRFYTIVLSFIPGCGHFQLGLMHRGITILISFLGLGAMIVFIAFVTSRDEFLIFLVGLPVIWLYGFFDAMQQLNKIEKGEELTDRSILEDLEMMREEGKKSRSIATVLSVFPGAGHLYLGLQRRGIQLMAAFLFSIYILDVLRLGIFLFLLPLIWFYSFFDGMQNAAKYGKEPLEDRPIISYFKNYQKWVGLALVFLGLYYFLNMIIMPSVSPFLANWIQIDLQYWFSRYFQTAIVCLLLIGGGIKLLLGSKGKKPDLAKSNGVEGEES